ncbi:MAG TPA: polysaccharide biosynthesis/export family protein [Gemmatimonadaceae bacterium]|nr:polysaccharide biosynthesis/export family protein [Gemmatimonadaceae bacterium]
MTRKLKYRLLATMFLAATAADAQSAGGPQALNPGDQVRIVVWRNVELSGDFTVAANGTLNHPLYREVQVTGIPLSSVEDRLRTFISRYATNPQFVILPLLKIVVGGEVRSPNVFSVPPETTVTQAVILAGGPSERGKLDNVRLLREGQTINLDMGRPDSQAASLQVRSGDQIIVPRSTNVFRDFLGPTASMVGAIAAIVSIFMR